MPPWIEFSPKQCKYCGSMFGRGKLKSGRPEGPEDYRKRIYCSKDCYHAEHRGSKHHNYKPVGAVTCWGYVRSVDPDGSGRRAHTGRLLMEKKLGRRLLPNEHVHHKDHNRLNNDFDNLELITAREHALYHSARRKRNALGQYT